MASTNEPTKDNRTPDSGWMGHRKRVPGEPNRLAKEQSPYLRQHADNPVDWYPWGPKAFDRAKKENKPIFLSIGYSTCHWCHVMEHECFEDDQVAALMNEAFVNIKVDREERPDIDRVYMTVAQIMTGAGGWPLTIVMTPDKKPFFAATFIPKLSSLGRLGMMDLIPRITRAWKEHRGDIGRTADNVATALRRVSHDEPTGQMGHPIIERAISDLKKRYDPIHGGFGKTMKFPRDVLPVDETPDRSSPAKADCRHRAQSLRRPIEIRRHRTTGRTSARRVGSPSNRRSCSRSASVEDNAQTPDRSTGGGQKDPVRGAQQAAGSISR